MNRNAVKICKTCRKVKTLAEFYRHNQCADGFRNSCKDCSRKNWKQPGKQETFLPAAITKMTKLYKSNQIEYFGYFIGTIIYLRKNEILAFSVLKGSGVFKYKRDAKFWLIKQIIQAGDRITAGLTRT